MPCPFRNRDDKSRASRNDDDSTRRAFMKTAVAIGGTSALSACVKQSEQSPVTKTTQFPTGVDDPRRLPREQHAWANFMLTDRQGNVVFPSHHVFLPLTYVGSNPPTSEERERVEQAFRDLEIAYQWGAGETPNAQTIDGLLFTIGYSPGYFDQFNESLPSNLDLPTASSVLERLGEDPAKAGDADALVHLASDQPQVVLSAEEALFGAIDQVNGHKMSATLKDIFERRERRTGFVGRGLPSTQIDVDEIPDRSPLSMGFKSAFEDTLPSEAKVTIESGPFAGGTTQHASELSLAVDTWYEDSHQTRLERMFSPAHESDEVGHVGEGLGSESGMTTNIASNTERDAADKGRVGHSQKLARARDDDFDPLILRRGDSNATGTPNPRLNFASLQTGIEKFITTRMAMNEIGFDSGSGSSPTERDTSDSSGRPDSSIPMEDHGILDFIEVHHRANYLIPPRENRALPTPGGA